MEHIVNQIILTGNLAGAPRYSHENHGRRFYAFPLEVERLSGTTDTLPVLAPLELLEQTPAAGGDTLCVTGQIRSYNNRAPEVLHGKDCLTRLHCLIRELILQLTPNHHADQFIIGKL